MNSFNRRGKVNFSFFLTFILCLTITFSTSLLRAQDAPAEEEEQETQEKEKTKSRVFRLDDVVVSATKTEIDPKETGASISIIEEEQVENRGERSVIEALHSVPGLTVYRQGAPGGVSTLFIRGADSKNMLVLIDGVEVNDPSGIDRSFDFANLTTDNIERIEVIRGAQSTLYGSDATGGIINIITKKGKGKPSLTLKAEAGSYNSFRESLTVNGGSDDAHYSFGIARIDTKGFSTAAREPGTSGHMDEDGYTNTTFSGRTGYRITDSTWLTHVLRYTDADAELDDGAYYDDPNYAQSSKQISSALSLDQELFIWWSHKIILSYMNIERRYEDKTDDAEPSEFTKSWYEGTHHKAEWQHIFSIGDVDEITMGAEMQENSTTSTTYSDIGFGASTDQFDERDIWERAAYIQNHLKLMNRIFAIAGIRYNDHETFGNEITYSLSGSIISPLLDTRLKGNYATGFRAPVMTQIYDTAYTTGNPDLKPETSITWDIGISQPIMNGKFIFEVTYFETEYKNKIDINDAFTQYINKEEVITKGIECALHFAPADTLSFDAAYTYLPIAKDMENYERLIRRPRHQGSLHTNWKFLPGGNLNLGINYMGKRDDAWYDESIFDTRDVKMDEYYTIDISTSYWLLESIQVFGRIENMLNEDYEFPIGYNTPGRSYYAGLKAVL